MSRDKKMKDNKKTNQIRRQRGYTFETDIVKKFKNFSGWDSRRLGSPSTALPDVMCVNNFYKTMIAIEAKSSSQKYAYVPVDQIRRCIQWVNLFSLYDSKIVILAFKFGRIKICIGKKAVSRPLKYYYKIFPHKKTMISDIRCDYEGNTLIKSHDETWDKIVMEDFKF